MKRLLTIAVLLAAFGGSLVSASIAVAYNSNIGGEVRSLDHDYCPNIPGQQASIPIGMIIDADGNCVTPPQPVDVCSNIDGIQEAPPAGYYWRESDNSCQPQPPQEIDVCPNLSGMQTVVSAGYEFRDGACVMPPIVDMCHNIDGVQATIPYGMARTLSGTCLTPSSPVIVSGGGVIYPSPSYSNDPIIAVEPDPRDTTPPLDGIGEREWTPTTDGQTRPAGSTADVDGDVESSVPWLEFLGRLFPPEFRAWLNKTPVGVARGIPYGLIAAMALAALGLFIASLSYLSAANAFLLILGRQRRLAEQKDGFIMLISHYLRSPVTLLRGGLDTAIATGQVTTPQVRSLNSAIETLHGDVDDIVGSVQGNTMLEGIQPPEEKPESKASRLLWFVIPVGVSVVLTVIANFLFGVVGGIDLGLMNLIAQILLGLTVIMILYTAVKNHQTRKRNKEMNEELVTHEKAIDEVRTKFINEVTEMLDRDMARLDASAGAIASLPDTTFYTEGHNRLENIHSRLRLLVLIKAEDSLNARPLDVRDVADTVIATVRERYPDKSVTIDNQLPSITVSQDPRLFTFLIDSIVDNAVKFSDDGSHVSLVHQANPDQIVLEFIDSGVGIDANRLEYLFKPFSRATDVEQFDYEGLGFSLFLDRIIMDYTGGTISLKSTPGEGTLVRITTPLQFPAHKS